MSLSKDILQEVVEIMDGQFQENRKYPPFNESMENVAKAATAILHKEITAKDITFIMVLLKMDRESESSKVDNIKDAIAYMAINLDMEDYYLKPPNKHIEKIIQK